MELVPGAYAPQVRRHEALNPWHKSGQDKEAQEDELFARAGFLQPRRHNGNDDVEAYERIHKPQVASHRGEGEGQILQVGQ